MILFPQITFRFSLHFTPLHSSLPTQLSDTHIHIHILKHLFFSFNSRVTPCQGWSNPTRTKNPPHSPLPQRDPAFSLIVPQPSSNCTRPEAFQTMLMNTTSFLISQLRSTVSATVNSTNHLLTTIKKSLSLVQESNEHSVKHKHLHNQASSTDLGYSNTNDTHLHNGDVTQATPLQHEQYPSLQPWRGLDRRIKNFGLSMPVSANYTAPRHPIVLCHGMVVVSRSFKKEG